MQTLTREQARVLAISAQGLQTARPATPDGMLDAIRQIRCVQLDPISAVARSQALVLRNRTLHASIDALNADFSTLQHERRDVFEYWAHCASVVLSEDYGIHARRMRRYQDTGALMGGPQSHTLDASAWARRTRVWVDENDALKKRILGEIKKHGPLPSSFFEDESKTSWQTSGWNAGRNVGKMLDWLWFGGVLTVGVRNGNSRQWDLAERVIPANARRQKSTDKAATHAAILHAVRALGFGTQQQINLHFTRYAYPDLAQRLTELVKARKLITISADGIKGACYTTHESLDFTNTAAIFSHPTRLLSPFDNLICDRKRTLDLFGFDFKIEIYVPPAKRKFGYYVLPILHNNALVGRIDSSYDKATRVYAVRRVFAEPGQPRDRTTGRAIRAEIERLGLFLGAKKTVIDEMPGCWK